MKFRLCDTWWLTSDKHCFKLCKIEKRVNKYTGEVEEILNPAKMDLIEYSLPIIKVAKSDLMEKGGFTAEKIRSELSLLFSVSVANTATRTTEEKLSLIKVLI